ncbi:MAG TPA: glycosyltransferase family 87 protein [Bryobacteraceae bacterium]|nr:glycosyltransferase family 87 protein [Bryobacteraceae bacterium]
MARIPLWVGLTVVGLSAMWIALGSLILPAARSHDFLNLYTGASLAREGHFADLHDPEVQLARERRIFPQLPSLVPFVRPAFYAAVLMPLALLPYGTAFVVWIAAQSALLLACWAWSRRRFGADALVFAALFLPCPLGIASGQDCVMMLALFILAFELAEGSRWFAAGAALALMLMKFHLILLWPVALLVQRRWRMLAGFCATALALVGICVALGGINSLRVYAALLQNKSLDHLSPSPELMISFQGMLANLGIETPWASGLLIAAAVVVFLWSVRTAPLWRMFALTAAASLWIVPHVYGYDASLLLLPILLTIFRSAAPASRIAATLLSTPIPFGFALAGRPWAIVSSASLAIFLVLLAVERNTPGLKDRARPS